MKEKNKELNKMDSTEITNNSVLEKNKNYSNNANFFKKKRSASDDIFQKIDSSKLDNSVFMSVPLHLTVELGKKKITIQELLQLSNGSILALEDKVDEPLNIFVNNFLIALGELVVHNNKYGVRIIKLMSNQIK
ncbi:flagellar motor switch protein FliN [Buchnera aphidicola]|uniref:Flagellar motor switch protein FliN n=1 Tax=Buchnera aphidicola (Cinara strobi) TaxID=1921549 RepID=A0A3B1E9B7_9GAMM|nr:flagellar motor switch protein FliN [Buchnera aphidicola]VAX76269.1 Flagellar motor switch protein FliN [Buchnera aphidicola (Cinara strobi)]